MDVWKQLLLTAGGTVTGGAIMIAVLSLIQVSKIKIDPWDVIRKWIGAKFNAEQIAEIAALKRDVKKLSEKVDEFIRTSNDHTADEWRQKILSFNNQLLRDIPHTKEDFIEVLSVIDRYNEYCDRNPGYKNQRAVHAIAHIGHVYDNRLEKHDFLTD